ncbi:carcinoembryonic antigen-related cell adhesion molecule 5-like [Mastacembelus armatus]|uniref:carcinoembryonic antigen-related cell adhesion molecule 5-like n=1 Tax=Mastacembelus armatus TaxID=205130 RepID=UPI000E460EDB|nr:carcinoembryonic antigen-related cell adhesion molecule 5-like [Mastacembelus armatus]
MHVKISSRGLSHGGGVLLGVGFYELFSGRVSFNDLTGALTLSSITVADSGVYVVQSSDPKLWANTSITVLDETKHMIYTNIHRWEELISWHILIFDSSTCFPLVPISNVTLKANQTDLIEFKSSAVVTCSASSGSSLSFLWLNGSSEVTASDRVQLTDGNSTLTIVNVTRYDQGPFMYGPDNMALTVNEQITTSFLVGSNLTLLCSAKSNPPAQLQWAFRGELMNTTGPLLELYSISEAQSGPYTCLAFNILTDMTSKITTQVTIASSQFSASEQQVAIVCFLPLLLLTGLLLPLPGALE